MSEMALFHQSSIWATRLSLLDVVSSVQRAEKCSSKFWAAFCFVVEKASLRLCEEELAHLTADGALLRLYAVDDSARLS
jgi:hypothetical protein